MHEDNLESDADINFLNLRVMMFVLTTDKNKESVLNIIQTFIPNVSVCLDMFAGSGALSFEAISRGAKKAVCLDKDKRSIDIIKKNANSLDFSDYCEIINTSCFDYMERAKEKFDVIFLDPPYNKNFIEPVLEGIVKNNLLNEDGIVVLESDGTRFHDDFDGLEMYRKKHENIYHGI